MYNKLGDVTKTCELICNLESGKGIKRKDLEEIQRIIRIFNIADEQHNKHTMLSIKNLATFKLVLSNN